MYMCTVYFTAIKFVKVVTHVFVCTICSYIRQSKCTHRLHYKYNHWQLNYLAGAAVSVYIASNCCTCYLQQTWLMFVTCLMVRANSYTPGRSPVIILQLHYDHRIWQLLSSSHQQSQSSHKLLYAYM